MHYKLFYYINLNKYTHLNFCTAEANKLLLLLKPIRSSSIHDHCISELFLKTSLKDSFSNLLIGIRIEIIGEKYKQFIIQKKYYLHLKQILITEA